MSYLVPCLCEALRVSSSYIGMFLKVIACEIAFREISHLAAASRHVVDLDFVTQGLHDTPLKGREELQRRIDAIPPEKYDRILIGYGLCGNIITGLTTAHTPLVIPRAHDCITLFLGSRERYQRLSASHPGSYYYSSGWLECMRRRGQTVSALNLQFLPTRAGANSGSEGIYAEWVQKYGEERARYLLDVMGHWTQSYTHGVLIDFDFTKPLHLHEQVEDICERRGWRFEQLEGDLRLLQCWLDGEWDPDKFLTVFPGNKVAPSYRENIIQAEAVACSD